MSAGDGLLRVDSGETCDSSLGLSETILYGWGGTLLLNGGRSGSLFSLTGWVRGGPQFFIIFMGFSLE